METPFESPRFLVAQTRENLDVFDGIFKATFTKDACRHVIDVEPRTGNKIYKVRLANPIPGRLRHIVVTAISDLRHALDQALCDAVEVLTNRDPGLLYFPFPTSPADLAGRLNSKQYATVPTELHAVIAGFEPYPTSEAHQGGNDLLSALGRAAGPNKHRLSCGIGAMFQSYRDGVLSGAGIINAPVPPTWDMNKGEMIVATVAPDGFLLYNFKLYFYITIRKAGALSDKPAADILRKLASHVESVIGVLERETARLLSERPR